MSSVCNWPVEGEADGETRPVKQAVGLPAAIEPRPAADGAPRAFVALPEQHAGARQRGPPTRLRTTGDSRRWHHRGTDEDDSAAVRVVNSPVGRRWGRPPT